MGKWQTVAVGALVGALLLGSVVGAYFFGFAGPAYAQFQRFKH